jgi:uncharacterized BrkB/YihY/UPF0761 family membrane protein
LRFVKWRRLSPRQIERYTLLAQSAVRSGRCCLRRAVIWYGVRFVLVYRFHAEGGGHLRDTLPGAFLAGCLWEIAKYIFA